MLLAGSSATIDGSICEETALLEFEIQRCTRQCAKTGRALAPGELFYSVLVRKEVRIERLDFSQEAWEQAPADAIAWWKSRMPSSDSNKPTWAPNQVLIDYFERLLEDGDPAQAELLYVLTLLLVRRRLLRIDSAEPPDSHVLAVTCSLNDRRYRVPIATPPRARFAGLEEQLRQLLFGDHA